MITQEKSLDSMTHLIGNTPMVKLNRLGPYNAEIYAKLEMFNPGFSIKDRIALNMIENAEREGLLTPGVSTIIEPTSGNTGIGLAMICAIKGYECVIVMADSMSIERRRIISGFGAKVILTPGAMGFQKVIETTEELLCLTPNAWSPMQFDNPNNPEAHYQTTGPEIYDAMAGDIDYLFCGLGTGGTISGIAKYLKEQDSSIKVIAVEPENCALLSGGTPGLHKIQGLNAGFIANTTDVKLVDDVFVIKDEDAFSMARTLARKEGIFCGISSGAAAYAAVNYRDSYESPKRIVTVFPDSGERYLSTELWNM